MAPSRSNRLPLVARRATFSNQATDELLAMMEMILGARENAKALAQGRGEGGLRSWR
jgi:hypothetical protein